MNTTKHKQALEKLYDVMHETTINFAPSYDDTDTEEIVQDIYEEMYELKRLIEEYIGK